MPKFVPPKNFNTRKHLKVDAPFVLLMCQKLKEKIEQDWQKKWEPKFGESLEMCRKKRRFSALVNELQTDITKVFKAAHPELKGAPQLSITTIKRLINNNKPGDFFQENPGNMLAIYVGYPSWTAFKAAHQQAVVVEAPPCATFAPEPDTDPVLLFTRSLHRRSYLQRTWHVHTGFFGSRLRDKETVPNDTVGGGLLD
ncbi:hypothetical protein [Rhodoflexus sp.]